MFTQTISVHQKHCKGSIKNSGKFQRLCNSHSTLWNLFTPPKLNFTFLVGVLHADSRTSRILAVLVHNTTREKKVSENAGLFLA